MITMNLMFLIAAVFTVLLFIGVVIGKFTYKKPNNTAFIAPFSAFLGAFLVFYMISFAGVGIFLFCHKNLLAGIIAVIFAISPFVIGNIASYKESEKYINIQLLSLVISLIYLVGFKFI